MESSLSHFVVEQNIRRFVNQLRWENDDAKRSQLQKLLIEEEDRLGFTVGRLEELDQAIAEGDKRIDFQLAKLGTLKNSGRDIAAAESVLKNMEQIQTIYRQYRVTLQKIIDRNRILTGELPGAL
jgi:hypothetical protein